MVRFKYSLVVLVAIALGGFESASCQAATVFDFQFNDAVGTNLFDAVDSSGNGYNFGTSAYQGVETNGTGAMVFGFVNGATIRANRAVALLTPDRISASVIPQARLTTVFAPWNFSNPLGSPDFRFGFGSNSGTNNTAQFYVQRFESDPNRVSLATNASTSTGANVTSASSTALFDAVMTESVTVFLDLDKLINQYSVSYKIGSGPEIPFFTGVVDPARDGNFVRFSLFSDGTTPGVSRLFEPNFFAVDSITLTAIPEPSSFVVLGTVALVVFARKRRRSVASRLPT